MKRETKAALNGKFEKVENMQSSSGRDVPNQFNIFTDKAVIFQSYDSIIAIKQYGKRTIIGKDFDYSKTTMKYLKEFLRNSGVIETRKLIDDGTYLYDGDLR
jgi:hypothetical protein